MAKMNGRAKNLVDGRRALAFVVLVCVLVCAYAADQPNIVLIVADDLGWNDVGFHGSNQIPTPNIDVLAYNGIILNSHYVQSTCTPSRTALLTGKYPMRLGMQGYPLQPAEKRAVPEGKLLPEYFKDLGYSTHLVGKWHLGYSSWNETPTFRGFDHHFGYYNGFISYYDYLSTWRFNDKEYTGFDLRKDGVPAFEEVGKYVTDAFTEYAVKTIQDNDGVKPLFLMLAHTAVHAGNVGKLLEAPQETINKFKHVEDSNRRTYAAMVSKLDDSVGTIVQALADKNILSNSIVVFLSDNGAPTVAPAYANWGSNYPLRGVKQTLFEGGIRGSAFIYSPLLVQSGRVSTDLMHITDWLPTLFSAAGGDIGLMDPDLDGIDQWSSLVYDLPSPRNDILINIDEKTRNAALRFYNWKLIVGTSLNGTYNDYYGDVVMGDIEPQSYDTASVFDSPAGRSVRKASYTPLSEVEYEAVRRAATLTCLGPKAKKNPCDPASDGMLLHVSLGIVFFLFGLKRTLSVSLNRSQQSKPQRNNHQNISTLLDNLLSGYDNSIRPDFGGPPAVIEVDINVRSMGPISEVDMTYSMDCYFRQSWVDKRLAFSLHSSDTLALSISMLAKIWKPDTYFYNGKQSYLHTITTPNKFVRLFQDGRVLYSSRLTIKAGCPMNLEDFPMDIQRCPLKFGSFGYTNKDVIYKWKEDRQVAIAEDMKLSQFDLIATPAANHTDNMPNPDAKSGVCSIFHSPPHLTQYSMLLVSFHLQRHMGNFLIQVYGPCVLLVVLSWVSFWLNREATADRVSLGITTVLTMTFLGLEARTDLPKVPYPTALDFFVFLSFSFIFATIIQFAVVHYFTKYGSGECYFSTDISSESDSSDDEEWTSIERKEYIPTSTVCESNSRKASPSPSPFRIVKEPQVLEVIPLSACSIPVPQRRSSQPWTSLSCIGRPNSQTSFVAPSADLITNQRLTPHRHSHRKKKRRAPRFNSVSKIDRASRVVFPLLFVTINLFYWYCYLYRTNRISYK